MKNGSFNKALESIPPETEQLLREYVNGIKKLRELFEKYKDKHCDHHVMPSMSIEAAMDMAREYHTWKQGGWEYERGMILHISTPNIQNPFLCYVKGASGKYIYIGQANTLTEAKEIINETL